MFANRKIGKSGSSGQAAEESKEIEESKEEGLAMTEPLTQSWSKEALKIVTQNLTEQQ